jgi:O-antigen/teichoic acid export membrane protein
VGAEPAPKRDLTKRASLNALAAAIEYGTRLVVGFVVNPILVSGLGGFAYGVWQVLGRLMGYMSAAGGRPSQALKWSIANRQASTDADEKRRQVGSSLIVATLFLPILFPIGLGIAWFVPGWLDSPPEMVWPIRAATGILVANLVLLNFLAVPRSILEGENLGYKRMGISAVLAIVGGGLMVLAVRTGTGLPGVALAMVVATVLTAVTYLFIVRAYVPWFGLRRPSRGEVRAFLGLSGWFLGWRLVIKALRTGDVVVLGIADSAELVSVYALTRYVPETLITFVAMLVMGVAPGLGGLIGSGEKKKSAAVRADLMSFAWILVTVAGAGILLWNRSFVGLWVGPEFYAGDIANLLIVILVAQFVFVRTDANIIDLTLDLRNKVFVGVLAGVVSVGLSTAFVLAGGGIIGLCAGFLIGRGILTFAYPAIVGRALDIQFTGQVGGAMRPAVVTALLFGLGLAGGREVRVDTWLALIGVSIATVLVAGPIAFFAGLDRQGRNRIMARVRRISETFQGKGSP